MNLDMWFKDDIRNILLGLEVAAQQPTTGLSPAEQAAYRQGFNTALTAVAASFGLLKLDGPPRTAVFRGNTPSLPARNEW